MPRSRSLLVPSVVTVVSALVVVVAAFVPWYQTAIGPTNAPDTVTGWEATAWAKLAVAAAAICALSALVVTLDIRGEIALHGPVRRVMAGIALGTALIVAVCVLFRLVFPPDPALGVTRQLGLIIAAVAAVTGLWGAGALFSRTFPERQPRAPRRRRRPRAPGPPPTDRASV
jgi:4-amino-4-deoxy-L-arabinose transferase-like glycosyltransferase